MRKSLRTHVLSGAVFALVALPTVTMAQSVNDIISRGKLIVAIDTTTPPYGFLDEKLEPTGFDIDVAKKMGEGAARRYKNYFTASKTAESYHNLYNSLLNKPNKT